MSPPDKCDICGCAMKHKRLGPTYLFACDDCRVEAMRRLGRSVYAIAIGIKAEVSREPA